MKYIATAVLLISVSLLWLAGSHLAHSQEASNSQRLVDLSSRLLQVQQRAERIRDINTIQNLQRSYGYYTDKMLWDHVVDLFSADATLEVGMSGVYQGKEHIRSYLYSLSGGEQGPHEGKLNEHLQFQPVITLADNGLTAKARWRTLMMLGESGSGSGGQWGAGPYENEYIKEDGVWKISKLHWYPTFIVPYEGGWLQSGPDAVREYSVRDDIMPDQPSTQPVNVYPDTYHPPFHFTNPVTGGTVQ